MSPRDKLDDHLSDTVTTQSLATHEALTLDAGQCIEDGRDEQDDGSDDKAGRLDCKRDPLDDTHCKVDRGAHVIGLESANECIKRGRRWADAQEKGDFDKEDDERADTGHRVSVLMHGFICDYHSQAYHGEQDDPVEEENVANAETETQNHADYTSPIV